VPVAALYDIHGNLPALEAVLAEVPADATIVVGGDVVAGGQQASEVLERLLALGDRVVWIRGNGDRELDPNEEGLAPAGALDETRAQLTDDQAAFLVGLPATATVDGVLYCHATPRNDVDIFTEETPEERLTPVFADVDADVVVCGHTHMQFDRVVGGTRIVNAGSVGMAYDEPPGAYWLLDLEHRRTDYDGTPAASTSRAEVLAYFTERGL
jgi:putative phosphoesterase